MQDNPEPQPIGEIVSPQLEGAVQTPMMGQPMMQQNVMYIQMPKFRHPTRIISSVLAMEPVVCSLTPLLFVKLSIITI